MYEYIKGEITSITPANLIIEAAGVGYFVNISLQTYSALENERQATVYIHYIIREDAQIFFGFAGKEERELFRLLLGVSGVGGNTARMILSTYSPRELTNIISTENAALLKNVKGLGLKTAQKIIVELRDKVVSALGMDNTAELRSPAPSGEIYEEALAALTMLGFGKSASDKVLRNVIRDNPEANVESVIRLSLKKL